MHLFVSYQWRWWKIQMRNRRRRPMDLLHHVCRQIIPPHLSLYRRKNASNFKLPFPTAVSKTTSEGTCIFLSSRSLTWNDISVAPRPLEIWRWDWSRSVQAPKARAVLSQFRRQFAVRHGKHRHWGKEPAKEQRRNRRRRPIDLLHRVRRQMLPPHLSSYRRKMLLTLNFRFLPQAVSKTTSEGTCVFLSSPSQMGDNEGEISPTAGLEVLSYRYGRYSTTNIVVTNKRDHWLTRMMQTMLWILVRLNPSYCQHQAVRTSAILHHPIEIHLFPTWNDRSLVRNLQQVDEETEKEQSRLSVPTREACAREDPIKAWRLKYFEGIAHARAQPKRIEDKTKKCEDFEAAQVVSGSAFVTAQQG